MKTTKKIFNMPPLLGVLLMPVMIVFSGVALVTYLSTATITIIAIQAAGVVMAGYSLVHRIFNNRAVKLSHQ